MGLTPDAVLAGGLLDDPWLDGRPRFAGEPLVLPRSEAGALAEAACAVAGVLDEAVQAVAATPALAVELGLDPSLAAIAAIDLPRWLVLARADVFRCDGAADPQVCELNCDTPTGLAECTGLAALAAADGAFDPSARLGARWSEAVAACFPVDRPAVVGIVDPTEMTEDLGHLRLVARWLRAAGAEVVRGSPFNLHACPGGRVGLFGRPIDVLVRHYKTDWWAARRSVWRDEPPPPDHAPLAGPLALIAAAQEAGTLAVVNPWGAAVAQSKRALALPWERPELFSADALAAARRFLPEGRYAEGVPAARLIAERADWVLKGAWGCEGDEVLVGAETEPAVWARAVAQMAPGLWLAQRAFRPRRDAAGRIANHGVYLVGGLPSGIYTRLSPGATGTDALAVPTLVAA
jgi:hypothetical protein